MLPGMVLQTWPLLALLLILAALAGGVIWLVVRKFGLEEQNMFA